MFLIRLTPFFVLKQPPLNNSVPTIFFDQRLLWAKPDGKVFAECPFTCNYTYDIKEGENVDVAVFTRSPTPAMAHAFRDAVWAFETVESALRLPSVHQKYRPKVIFCFSLRSIQRLLFPYTHANHYP